jgi:hypothetical protein
MSTRTRYSIVATLCAVVIGGAITAIAGAVGIFDSLASNTGPARIAFDSQYHDFGQVAPDEKLSTAFRFTNRGGQTLRILRAKASCGCTVVEQFKKELAPNESEQITVTFDAGSVPKGVHHYVWIDTNDLAQPRTTLEVRAVVRAGFRVIPDAIQLHSMAPGQAAEPKVELVSLDDEPFSITAVVPSSTRVSATFDLNVSRRIHRGLVRLRAGDSVGYVRESLLFRTTHPDRDRAIVALSAQVVGPVVANPDRVTLSGLTKGSKGRARVLLVGRDRAGVDVAEVTCPDEMWAMQWKTTATAEEYLLWLELEMRPPWLTGHTATEVRVDLKQPSELSLRIPVEAIVESLKVE